MITASHSSMVMFTNIRSRRIPALLTTTSRPPKVSIAVSDQPARAVPVRDVVVVRHGLATSRADCVDDVEGGTSDAPRRRPCTEIVHHDLGSLAGQLQRVSPTDTPTGSGDDGDASLIDPRHCASLPCGGASPTDLDRRVSRPAARLRPPLEIRDVGLGRNPTTPPAPFWCARPIGDPELVTRPGVRLSRSARRVLDHADVRVLDLDECAATSKLRVAPEVLTVLHRTSRQVRHAATCGPLAVV